MKFIDSEPKEVQDKFWAQSKMCKDQGLPNFSMLPCPTCHKMWTDKYTLEEAGKFHLTYCEFCHMSWCD